VRVVVWCSSLMVSWGDWVQMGLERGKEGTCAVLFSGCKIIRDGPIMGYGIWRGSILDDVSLEYSQMPWVAG